VSLATKLENLIAEFTPFEDLQERLTAVIDRARRLPPLPAAARRDENRVRGCVSVVWLVRELRDGRCYFHGEAESPVVRGLIALLCEFFSGATPADILASNADPLAALDLTRNLSPTRRNGLTSAHAAIRDFAATSLKGTTPC
jgi:cysteine desulfuration protein SufE